LTKRGKRIIFSKKKGKRSKGEDGESSISVERPRIVKRKGKKRKKKTDDEEDEIDEDDDDYEYRPSHSRRGGSDNEQEVVPSKAESNPLPGFVDPITLDEVEKPSISPHGVVMSWESWSRVLSQEPKNTCPITKQIVKKRDLVVLTWENIDDYRSRIRTD